jgi:hypothetical protein
MATNLTITLTENRPGAFAAVAGALADAGVNIDGVTEVGGTVHLLVEEAARARQALEAAGHAVAAEQEVLVLSVPDMPGELARITRSLATAGVNLTFVYLATNTRIVLGVDDLATARQTLGA